MSLPGSLRFGNVARGSPGGIRSGIARYQMRFTPYLRKTGSAVTTASFSSSACAINMSFRRQSAVAFHPPQKHMGVDQNAHQT